MTAGERAGLHLTLLLALGLLAAPPAAAVGPWVGPDCVASWSPVTARLDGSPIEGPVTYNLYLVSGHQTAPPPTPALTGLTTTSVIGCNTIPPGQYTIWVTAVEQLSTSVIESAPTPPYHFVNTAP